MVTSLQNRKTHRIWSTIFSEGARFNKNNNNFETKKKYILDLKGGGAMAPVAPPWLRLWPSVLALTGGP